MSIEDEIKSYLESGLLIRIRQSFPGQPEKRVICASPAIVALLDGPWNGDPKWEKRWNRVRQQIDEFIDGFFLERITVRSAPRKKSTCFMSLLDPEADEVWEIRCRDPKPGIRIFGSFVKQNFFVALSVAPHECLSTEADWNRAIKQYRDEWHKHFSTAPFSGVYPHDYLTDAVVFD